MLEVVARYGQAEVAHYMRALLSYAERMTRRLLSDLPDGVYRFQDQMDDDGVTPDPVTITVQSAIQGDEAVVDFSGSSTLSLILRISRDSPPTSS